MVELSAALAGAGGKARGLARLIAAGVAVPPGFALTGAAFRAVTGAGDEPVALDEIGHVLGRWARAAEEGEAPELEAEVRRRAAALGGPVIVRSSMSVEDGERGAAPGVGRSIGPIDPEEVWRAVRAVWVASLTPMVAIYARRSGGSPASPGVVVQAWVAGTARTVFTRPPGKPAGGETWIDAGDGAPERVARDAVGDARVALALAAERAIEADGGADVEMVEGADGWIVVQARPLVHPPARPVRVAPPPFVLAPLRSPPRAWRRDVTHNPDPMSVAQAGLCERVERAGFAPFHLAVVAGFLYSAPREGAAVVVAPEDAAALERRYAEAAARVEHALARADGTLATAIEVYLEAYRVLTVEIAPMIAAARAATAGVAGWVRRRPSSFAAAVAAAARGAIDRETLLEIVGDSAPAWDVACPTFRENVGMLDEAVLRAAARAVAADVELVEVPAELTAAVGLARAAADAAERDDVLFARAQAVVRRGLLGVAARRGLGGEDVFWLPIEESVGEVGEEEVEDWRRRAAGRARAARAAAARAAGWAMPVVIGPPLDSPAAGSLGAVGAAGSRGLAGAVGGSLGAAGARRHPSSAGGRGPGWVGWRRGRWLGSGAWPRRRRCGADPSSWRRRSRRRWRW